jgi:dynein heavy chain
VKVFREDFEKNGPM